MWGWLVPRLLLMQAVTAFSTAWRGRSSHAFPIERAGWVGSWPQEEVEQLADVLVHNIDPVREVTVAGLLLVRGGIAPCQLLIFLNVATATDWHGVKQFLGIMYIQAINSNVNRVLHIIP